MDTIIECLFYMGLSQTEMSAVLAHRFDYTVSVRHLRRILSRLQLYRRKEFSDLDSVVDFVSRQLTVAGQLHGYRFMHQKCITNGLIVDRETIRLILNHLDPEGVELRRRRRLVRRRYSVKGPNCVWHMDSYDKLKPFGICINGCVDGFSRYILWLEAYKTSSDPAVIGGYYIKTLEKQGGCPKIVRADRGTENGHVENMQTFLREDHFNANEERCFQYGRSTANQRIESFWGILRKQNAEYWIALFKDMEGQGHFSGDQKDKELIRFCFMALVQDDLDEVCTIWNSHKIRKYNNGHLHHGRPLMMYYVPELFDAEDHLSPVQDRKMELCREECLFKSKIPCDRDMYDLCCLLLNEHGLSMPNDPVEAILLYHTLRRLVDI